MSSAGGILIFRERPERLLICSMRGTAKRVASLTILFLLAASTASPLDWRSFAAASDSSSDAALLDAFAEGDTATRLDICDGLGARTEPSERAMIELIADGHRGNAAWDGEVFLRALLASLFRPSLDPAVLRGRIEANGVALDDLFSRIAEWRDPQLTEELVDLAPICAGPAPLAALGEVGERILHNLSEGGGMLMPEWRSLALAYLKAVGSIGNTAYLFSCTEIARLSRDKDLVTAARATARALISPATF